MRLSLLIAVLLLLAAVTPAANARPWPAQGGAVDASARCTALARSPFAFNGLMDAPTIINGAKMQRVEKAGVDVCLVDGYVAPSVGFRLALPVADWNGKYFQSGCGSSCGAPTMFWCDTPLSRGYACASTDMGHAGNAFAWAWAGNNLPAMVDFGYRATHVTAIAAKAIAAAFYGADTTKSYFYGCSTGGRQGMVEAERFPGDFDGIVAGAAPLDETGTAYQVAWSIMATMDGKGGYLLSVPDVQFLNARVVAACDMNDGQKDGLIGDPRQCRFRPESLRCTGEAAPGRCLTDSQLAAVHRLYDGPTGRDGRKLGRTGGMMKGSELAWINDYIPGPRGKPQYDLFIRQFFQYMSFNPAAGPGWDFKDLDWERDLARMAVNERLFSATDPDLRGFRDRGGKLITFQGWADTAVVPGQIIDYYDTMTRTIGGTAATATFARLFMVPGMRHCSSDGDGGDAIDFLSLMEDWVERGKAPDVAIGHARTKEAIAAFPAPVYPLRASAIVRTRPAFAYPAGTRYAGRGDPNDPASYRPVAPAAGRQ